MSALIVAQFMYIVRRRISLPSEKAMFLFVNKVLPTTRYEHNTIGFRKYVLFYKMVQKPQISSCILLFCLPHVVPQWEQSIQKIEMKMGSFMSRTVERTLLDCDFVHRY